KGLTRLRKSRQSCGHHGRRHILYLHIGALRDSDPQLRQHVGEALLSKRCLPDLITCAVQAHHQAIAHQLIGTHALYGSQILDAIRQCGGRQAQAQQPRCQPSQPCTQPVLGSEHHGLCQNGEILRKKRCNQPMVWTSSMTPLLRNSILASATCVDDTVLLPVIERGSTTPENRRYSLPRLMAICLSPAICRLPLGSTPITVVVSVPVNMLSARLEPVPSMVLPPPILKF